jgi:hypothetical protein
VRRTRFRVHHTFLVGQIVNKIDLLEETIAACTTEIDRLLGFLDGAGSADHDPGSPAADG